MSWESQDRNSLVVVVLLLVLAFIAYAVRSGAPLMVLFPALLAAAVKLVALIANRKHGIEVEGHNWSVW